MPYPAKKDAKTTHSKGVRNLLLARIYSGKIKTTAMQTLVRCAFFALLTGTLAAQHLSQPPQPAQPNSGAGTAQRLEATTPRVTTSAVPQKTTSAPGTSTAIQPVATPPTAQTVKPTTAPRVSYQNGELTVVAENSSLGETLNAIRAVTGIRIEGGSGGSDRVMAKIGPAPVRDVLLSLLEGSRYDFAMLGSPTDPQKVDRLVLSPRMASSSAPTQAAAPPQPMEEDSANGQPAADDDDNQGFAEPAKPAPPAPAAVAPGTPAQVKTPEQLLEDLKKLEADRAQQQQVQPTQPADPNAPRPARPERPK